MMLSISLRINAMQARDIDMFMVRRCIQEWCLTFEKIVDHTVHAIIGQPAFSTGITHCKVKQFFADATDSIAAAQYR